MAYQDRNGEWQLGNKPTYSQYQDQGLDPNGFTTTTTPGRVMGTGSGYYVGPSTTSMQYNDPNGGGTWSSNGRGGWYSGSGQIVNDLAGYLKMKNQQKSGADFQPYQQGVNSGMAGMASANAQYQNLLNNPDSVNQTAGYRFAVDQGNQAINRSAAARGQLNSGNVLAELARYGQGMGSQLYQQELGNRQQNFLNQGNMTNTMAGLMHGAQNFGLRSGYYEPPQNDGAFGARPKPSVW